MLNGISYWMLEERELSRNRWRNSMVGSRKLLQRVTLLLVTLMLASCTTMTGIGKIETGEANQLAVCDAWKPIYWKSSWPDDSILQAKQNNAARLAWGCPK
jgi:predicted small secreted protein